MNSIMETICGVCNSVRNNSKHGIRFHELLVALRKEFRKQEIVLKIKSVRSKKLSNEEFYVNAYYDSFDDKEGDVAVEVFIHHNFEKERSWNYKQITDFLVQIFDAVVHEFKHRRQSRKRKHEQYWLPQDGNHHYRRYLSDPDELDAYAFSIAIELCRTLGKFRALRYLHKVTSLARLKIQNCYASPNLSAYVGQFGDMSSPILKKLSKKIYVRLKKIDTDYIFQ